MRERYAAVFDLQTSLGEEYIRQGTTSTFDGAAKIARIQLAEEVCAGGIGQRPNFAA